MEPTTPATPDDRAPYEAPAIAERTDIDLPLVAVGAPSGTG